MEPWRQLRPRFRQMRRTAAWLVLLLWGNLTAATLAAWVWWPAHVILHGDPEAKWAGAVVLTMVFEAPVWLAWLGMRRVAWDVGPSGIEIYRRGVRRVTVPWSEVASANCFPRYLVVRTRSRPHGHELMFLDRADARWFEEVAGREIGDRAVPFWPRSWRRGWGRPSGQPAEGRRPRPPRGISE